MSQAAREFTAVVDSPARAESNDQARGKVEVRSMAEIENRSVSNLVEVMANERWSRLSKAIGSR
jgi:hypothetical protein